MSISSSLDRRLLEMLMPQGDDKKLKEYHRKRTAGITNEPFGDEQSGAATSKTVSGAFVVQLHDATRRHYDFRFEVGGVLLSFAVPHGPSLDPKKKNLAVLTEEHPIEYLEFEDVIPEKQYGAGPMIVWDRGTVEYLEGPAEDELAQGKLHVELRGMKLRGRFAFVKLAKGEKGNEWLFFKKDDEAANPERNIVEELPRSILSGLTVEEMEKAEAIGKEHVARAFKAGAKPIHRNDFDAIASAEIPPLMSAGSGTPQGDGWVYDAELDGVRVLAIREDDVVTIQKWGPQGPERIETFYPDVVRALRSLPVKRLIIDGSLVAFDPQGHPSMALLAQRVEKIGKGDALRAVITTPVILVATDILVLGDADMRKLDLAARRKALSSLLPALGYLRAATPLEGALDHVLESCAALGIAAVIAKHKISTYAPELKRSNWVHVPSGIAPRSRTTVDHAAVSARIALRKVTISNRTKVFWPEEGYTKGDLVDYYANVADTVLPYLESRPIILVRYPDGIDGKSFYQWNVPPGMPPWVRTLTIESEERDQPRRGFLVDDASTLQYLANLACIPLHILACRLPDLTRADFLTVDFDIKQSELRHAITLACTLKELLDAIGLPGFPKTSGQTGLHVLVPLGPGTKKPSQTPIKGRSSAPPSSSFDTARALADLLGKLLVERHPDIATMERIVNRRGPKVYVDTGQTGSTRAIVAPYSVRAVRGATVSTPLFWEEVEQGLDPRAFTIKTVPQRIAEKGDPFDGLLTTPADVVGAVAKLTALLEDRT